MIFFKVKLLLVFVFVSLISLAQPYGNEWINYNQSYYKFPVSTEGVVKIYQTDLINAGIAVSSLDPRNIQIFNRGAEIRLHIEGESDGSFDAGDFIELYIKGNDGFADEKFYSNPAG